MANGAGQRMATIITARGYDVQEIGKMVSQKE
jgi:hypothetical protein